jgi:hypothetical protein
MITRARLGLQAVLPLVASACMGWRTSTAPSPEDVARATRRSGIEAVRVVLKDGRQLDLRGPMIIGDSLVGFSRDLRADYARHAFAVKDIHTISTYGLDGALTATVVLVGIGATAALVAACFASLDAI